MCLFKNFNYLIMIPIILKHPKDIKNNYWIFIFISNYS